MKSKTFSQWFNEKNWYNKRFDEYVKNITNAEVLRNATAEDIRNNAHKFYEVWDVDSDDRENSFNFAFEELGLDYEVLYESWLWEKEIA